MKKLIVLFMIMVINIINFSNPKYISYIQSSNTNLNEKEIIQILNYIYKYSKKYNIDEKIILSIAKQESAFNKNAISKKGAIGIMQLMKPTAKELGVNPYNLEENIEGGIRYYSMLYGKHNSFVKSLAAYNAGEANLKNDRWKNFLETKNYVLNVYKNYKFLRNEKFEDKINNFEKDNIKKERNRKINFDF